MRKLSRNYRGWRIFRHVLSHRQVWLSVAVAVLVIVILARKSQAELPHILLEWQFWEPASGVSVLILAMLVWLGEASQDWENGLPKRVTAVFLYPETSPFFGHVAMACEKAYLAGETDLRGWSQQLGGQMSGDRGLQFSPFIRESSVLGRTGDADGDLIKCYFAVFQLTATPIPDPKMPAEVVDKIRTALSTGAAIHWTRGENESVVSRYDQRLRFRDGTGDEAPALESVA